MASWIQELFADIAREESSVNVVKRRIQVVEKMEENFG
jgi:hypothetical protein